MLLFISRVLKVTKSAREMNVFFSKYVNFASLLLQKSQSRNYRANLRPNLFDKEPNAVGRATASEVVRFFSSPTQTKLFYHTSSFFCVRDFSPIRQCSQRVDVRCAAGGSLSRSLSRFLKNNTKCVVATERGFNLRK